MIKGTSTPTKNQCVSTSTSAWVSRRCPWSMALLIKWKQTLCWHITEVSQICALLTQKHFPAPPQLGIQGTDWSFPHPYSSGVTKAGFPPCLAHIPPSWLEFKGSVRGAQGRPELTTALTESEVLWLVMLLSPKENNQHFSSMHMEKAHKC